MLDAPWLLRILGWREGRGRVGTRKKGDRKQALTAVLLNPSWQWGKSTRVGEHGACHHCLMYNPVQVSAAASCKCYIHGPRVDWFKVKVIQSKRLPEKEKCIDDDRLIG